MFLTFSENEDDVAAFSVTPRIMVLSVGEPAAAGFSVEMSDSSHCPTSHYENVPLDWSAYFLISYILSFLVCLFPYILYLPGKNRTPPNWEPSGLATYRPLRSGTLRIDKNSTPPNCGPSGLANYRPLRVVIFFTVESVEMSDLLSYHNTASKKIYAQELIVGYWMKT